MLTCSIDRRRPPFAGIGSPNFYLNRDQYSHRYRPNATKKSWLCCEANLTNNLHLLAPRNIFVVIAYADYAAYAKATSHPELSALVDAARNNPDPAWEGITITLNEEVEI